MLRVVSTLRTLRPLLRSPLLLSLKPLSFYRRPPPRLSPPVWGISVKSTLVLVQFKTWKKKGKEKGN